MTDLDKDYKFYKAKEWYDRPAYYSGRAESDEGRVETDLLHKWRNQDVAEGTRKAAVQVFSQGARNIGHA